MLHAPIPRFCILFTAEGEVHGDAKLFGNS